MVVWCDIAPEAANRQRTRERRREFSEPERSFWQAAWLQAMEGVQADGFFSQPLVERVNISDDITVRRFIAHRLLSSLRSRDYRDVERVVRDLGRLDGVTISSEETLLVGRRRLLDALPARPLTPDTLWPIAALALTYELEYLAAPPPLGAVATDAREMAQRLAELVPAVQDLEGADAALKPLLLYARATALMMASEFPEAETVAHDASLSCDERVWANASLCLDAGMAFGYARVMRELRASDPELMALPAERSRSGNRAEQITEARCRVVLVGDISDAGALVNTRISYENPAGICRRMAVGYATARAYAPIAEAQPGMRRRNIIIRFVLTSP